MTAEEARSALRDSLWLVPLLCLVGAIGLCVSAAAIDRATGNALIPRWVTGTPSAALTVLSTTVHPRPGGPSSNVSSTCSRQP